LLSGNRVDDMSKLTDDDVELIPLDRCISKIWKYFGFPEKDGQYLERDKWKHNEVTCCVCSKQFKYCGNTSNMRLHLSATHPNDFASMEKENEACLNLSKKVPANRVTVKPWLQECSSNFLLCLRHRSHLPRIHGGRCRQILHATF